MPRLRLDPMAAALALTLALGAAVAGPALAVARARRAAPRDAGPPQLDRAFGWTGELRTAAAIQAQAVDVLVATLQALALVVLAAAAVNLVTLLLARVAARGHRTAVAAVLGATPARIGRAELGRAARVALPGAALAVLLGTLAGRHAHHAWPGAAPLAPGARHAAWTAAAAAAIGALVLCSALVPAARAAGTRLYGALAAGGRATAGPGETLVRRALVVLQFAGAATLLTATVLLVRGSAPGAVAGAPGLDPRDTLVYRVALPQADAAGRAEMERRLVDAARAVPGVRAAAASHPEAWLGLGPEDRVRTLCDRCVWGNTHAPMLVGTARHLAVSPGWFAALGVPLAAGREPERGEGRAVLVNRAFAVTLLPRADPVGQRVAFGEWTRNPYTVVGVVEDVRAPGPGNGAAAPPTVYLSTGDHPPAELSIAARAGGDPAALMAPVARALAAAVPGARVGEGTTLAEAMERHHAPLRWFARVLAALAAAATLSAAGGLYGVMSFTVARRTREIGVRAALGATPARVLREVVGEGARLAAWGAAVGSIGALTVARLLQERFAGVDPLEPAPYLAVAIALAAVTLAASAIPARRAARLDAARALRAE